MKEVRFFYVPDVRQSTALPEEEAVPAVRVLRMVAGDELMLMDGNEVRATYHLRNVDEKEVSNFLQ